MCLLTSRFAGGLGLRVREAVGREASQAETQRDDHGNSTWLSTQARGVPSSKIAPGKHEMVLHVYPILSSSRTLSDLSV